MVVGARLDRLRIALTKGEEPPAAAAAAAAVGVGVCALLG